MAILVEKCQKFCQFFDFFDSRLKSGVLIVLIPRILRDIFVTRRHVSRNRKKLILSKINGKKDQKRLSAKTMRALHCLSYFKALIASSYYV